MTGRHGQWIIGCLVSDKEKERVNKKEIRPLSYTQRLYDDSTKEERLLNFNLICMYKEWWQRLESEGSGTGGVYDEKAEGTIQLYDTPTPQRRMDSDDSTTRRASYTSFKENLRSDTQSVYVTHHVIFKTNYSPLRNGNATVVQLTSYCRRRLSNIFDLDKAYFWCREMSTRWSTRSIRLSSLLRFCADPVCRRFQL